MTTATGQTVGNKTRVEREEEELVGWEIVGHPRDIKKGTVSRQHPERERGEGGMGFETWGGFIFLKRKDDVALFSLGAKVLIPIFHDHATKWEGFRTLEIGFER